MSRFTHLLGILTALFAGVVAMFVANVVGFHTPGSAVTTAPATSSIMIVPRTSSTPPVSAAATSTVAAPATVAPTVAPHKEQQAPVPTKTAKSQQTAPVTTATVSAPAASSSIAIAAPTQSDLDAASESLRSALVNILCYAPAGGPLHSISGSGVFIDSKGIILTNAHIGQYFLLGNRGITCDIRSGSPAVNKYRAALIYISPSWLSTNATVLTQAQPTGNGEYDFALLAVTSSINSDPLPQTFPFIALSHTPPLAGMPVVIASYGAQFLQTSQVENSLYPTIVFGSIKELFTYAINSIDAFSLGGSAAAQEGSSGGGVANSSGNLVGTITTSTVSGSTADRTLDAITATYIRSEYAREMGGSSLDALLAEPTSTAISEFVQKIPELEAIITADLPVN